jgi:hypothetical protein
MLGLWQDTDTRSSGATLSRSLFSLPARNSTLWTSDTERGAGLIISDSTERSPTKMSDTFAPDEFPCELLLNGVSVRSVRIRQINSDGNFDVVVTDLVGSFALHSDFEIDVCEQDSSRRRVSLDELKKILKSRYLLPADDLSRASEMAECRLFAKIDDIQIPHWEDGRLSGLGREEACVRYVQRILYRTGIPHLVSGTTFLVPSAPTAHIPLKRAGFRQSEISPSALVEPRTGCAIQVVERDPRK